MHRRRAVRRPRSAAALARDPLTAAAVGGVTASFGGGTFHSCAIKADGTVACWGSNNLGQATPPAGTFVQASFGDTYGCGIRTAGTLACWGGINQAVLAPPPGRFAQVSAGSSHACALKTDGSLVCWGDNANGQAAP